MHWYKMGGIWSEPKWSLPPAWKKQHLSIAALKASFLTYVENNKELQGSIVSKEINEIRVLTWNVHSWSDVYGRSSIDQFFRELLLINADILCLQEVVLVPNMKRFSQFGYCFSHFAPTSGNFGNLTVSRFPMKSFIVNLGRDPVRNELRCAIVSTIGKKNPITIINTHTDVWDETEQTRMKQMKILLSLMPNKNKVLLCGDLNSIHLEDYRPDVQNWIVKNDKERGKPTTSNAQSYLRKHLFSVFDLLPFNKPPATVWSGRIVDYIYLDQKTKPSLRYACPFFSTASDHIPLIADLDIN